MGVRLSQLKKKMPSGYRQKLCKDCKMNVHQIQGRPEDRISPVKLTDRLQLNSMG